MHECNKASILRWRCSDGPGSLVGYENSVFAIKDSLELRIRSQYFHGGADNVYCESNQTNIYYSFPVTSSVLSEAAELSPDFLIEQTNKAGNNTSAHAGQEHTHTHTPASAWCHLHTGQSLRTWSLHDGPKKENMSI